MSQITLELFGLHSGVVHDLATLDKNLEVYKPLDQVDVLADRRVDQAVWTVTKEGMDAHVTFFTVQSALLCWARNRETLDHVRGVLVLSVDLPTLAVFQLLDLNEGHHHALKMVVSDNLQPHRHFNSWELDHPVKGFVTYVLQKVDKTAVNTFVDVTLYIDLLEDDMESFVEDARGQRVPRSIAEWPLIHLRNPFSDKVH